ncbi:MAG: McrB family protein [Kurthia gibsonii]
MNEIIVEDLVKMSTGDIGKVVTNKTIRKLYRGDLVIIEEKNNKNLYLKTLSFFSKHGVEVTEIKGINSNNTGDSKYTSSKMIKVEGTDIYVDVNINNKDKFTSIKNGFKKLENEDLSLYRFVIEQSNNKETDESEDEIAQINSKIDNVFEKNIKNHKQVIFTGAPGTGKTWLVRNYVDEATKKYGLYKFVQFHSSYDYTDFVEGLRPVPDGNGGNMFVRMDGTFKAFCREIVKENLERLKGESKFNITNIESYFQIMKEGFHTDSIADFLDEVPYYFIIDEINRADLSRVFGELMFGLEDSYREIHNRFDTQYKNLSTYEMRDGEAVLIQNDHFKDGFFVPTNLHIIGTMNDIDRSVESFDFALRRRFVWVDVKANSIMFKSLKSMRDDNYNESLTDEKLKLVVENIKNMNNIMTETRYGLSEAYHIGPAYFKELVRVSDDEVENKLEEIFVKRIDSILREYTRGRKSNVDDELIKPCKIMVLGRENE